MSDQRQREVVDTLLAGSRLSSTIIRTVPCNLAEKVSVSRLFDEVADDGGICGVIHCDSVVVRGNWRDESGVDSLEQIWRVKVDGALHLHGVDQAQKKPASLFILYGASSAMMGSASGGEIEAASANAALESLAIFRRQKGLPAICIHWGPWSGIGYPPAEVLERLEYIGLPPVSYSMGALLLTTILNEERPWQLPTVVCCQPIDWRKMVSQGPDYLLKGDLACFDAVKNRVPPKLEPVKLTDDVKVSG